MQQEQQETKKKKKEEKKRKCKIVSLPAHLQQRCSRVVLLRRLLSRADAQNTATRIRSHIERRNPIDSVLARNRSQIVENFAVVGRHNRHSLEDVKKTT